MTRVVNKYKEAYDVYIGRDGTREEVIEKYRVWVLTQPQILDTLHTLKGKRLGCFCKPKACHGDVLVSLLEEGTDDTTC